MRDFNRKGRGRGDREMFDAICDECGDHCQVPFKPTGNKPIFCSRCFEKQGGSSSRRDSGGRRNEGRRDRNFSRPRSREREMYSAVCDECGQKCEVPFKPSNDKPIYCSDCFAKKEKGRDRESKGNNRGNQYEKEFRAINEKLDKILQTLSLTKVKKVTKKASPKKKVAKKKSKKLVSKKKVVKKKTTKKISKKKLTKKTAKKK